VVAQRRMSLTERRKLALTALAHCVSLCVSLCVYGCPSTIAGGESKAEAHKAAPAQSATAPGLQPKVEPQVVLMPPGRDPVTVRVEVARTEDERRRGLMFRKRMEQDAGMLFLFERPEQLTFWMRNTYIPLDMIFIAASMRVLGVVENAEPLTDASRSVEGQSQYVLEVNAGLSRRYGLTKGTAVRFEGVSQRSEGK
jgi:uncharacterized membrane protein (UPF0127 family)